MAIAKELGEKNKKEGDAFLAENKTREGSSHSIAAFSTRS